MAEMTDEEAYIIEVEPVADVDELIERYGFHPAQIVWSADDEQAYSITQVMRDAWFPWESHGAAVIPMP